MIGYVLLGGIIFRELEGENEKISRVRSLENVEKMVNRIYGKIKSNSIEINDQKFEKFLGYEIEYY